MIEELQRIGKRVLVILPSVYSVNTTLIPNRVKGSFARSIPLKANEIYFLQELANNKLLYSVPRGMNDDIFWMMATVYQGRKQGCYVVTNDLMRDHAIATLANSAFARLRTSTLVYFSIFRPTSSQPEVVAPHITLNSTTNNTTHHAASSNAAANTTTTTSSGATRLSANISSELATSVQQDQDQDQDDGTVSSDALSVSGAAAAGGGNMHMIDTSLDEIQFPVSPAASSSNVSDSNSNSSASSRLSAANLAQHNRLTGSAGQQQPPSTDTEDPNVITTTSASTSIPTNISNHGLFGRGIANAIVTNPYVTYLDGKVSFFICCVIFIVFNIRNFLCTVFVVV